MLTCLRQSPSWPRVDRPPAPSPVMVRKPRLPLWQSPFPGTPGASHAEQTPVSSQTTKGLGTPELLAIEVQPSRPTAGPQSPARGIMRWGNGQHVQSGHTA